MAIYRTGTASMTAAGVVTGVGTKWKDSLSLIRVGATIVFLTNPLNLATISAIVSDTELRVITSDAAAVPAGTKYVILLHDSITVDGLAQDVAETLRYYQGKESEIAEAIEFFETFDFDKLKAIGDQVKADAASAAQSKADAAASQQAALTSSAAAGQARDQAQSANTAAQQANTSAQGAKTDAIAARDAAKQYADSVNPTLLLHSANNLSDVADKSQALKNLQDGKPLMLQASPVGQWDATPVRWVQSYVSNIDLINSKLSIVNGSPSMPTNGAEALGGKLSSDYRVNDVSEATFSIQAIAHVGAIYRGRVTVYNKTKGTNAIFEFRDDGGFLVNGEVNSSSVTTGSLSASGSVSSNLGFTVTGTSTPILAMFPSNANSLAIGGRTRLEVSIDSFSSAISNINFSRRSADGSSTGQINVALPQSSGTLALAGTSDINYKEDVKSYDGNASVENIKAMDLVTFVFKDDDKKRTRRGVIAQQIEKIDKSYVKHTFEPEGDEIHDSEGNFLGYTGKKERVVLDTNVILLDAICALKVALTEIDDLKAQIEELKK